MRLRCAFVNGLFGVSHSYLQCAHICGDDLQVADVKRFNGLTTDLQMFALKTLRIPTPGRHPPSGPTQFKLVCSPLSLV